MHIINKLINFKNKFARVAMALGTFDGVHKGHQQVISRAVKLAKQINGTSLVFTFWNHPLSIINPAICPLQIMLPEYKEHIMEGLNIDGIIHIPFTAEILKLTPEQFIELICDNLDLAYIIVGKNHSFGYNGIGTPELLKAEGLKRGFEVEIQEPVIINNMIVSSTFIRKLILAGNVKEAAGYLNRNFVVQGKVVHGDSRGKVLGYPTANVDIPAGMITPPDGVYAVSVDIDKKFFFGVANIGNNPTFSGQFRRIETFILDFNAEIYGKVISIVFIDHIRGEVKFTEVEQLKSRIAEDIEYAKRKYFDIY